MDQPIDKNIDEVHDFIHDATEMDSKAVKQGYQIHYSNSNQRSLLIELVDENEIIFENPGRIELSEDEGDVLLLPSEWRN